VYVMLFRLANPETAIIACSISRCCSEESKFEALYRVRTKAIMGDILQSYGRAITTSDDHL
jgi:hypothetical protein